MSLAAGLYDITNETLGKGHFAVVKLARHCLSSELVAVKIVDKTKLTAESLQQHNLEVKLLSRLSEHEHPNIVRLYQVINTKSKLYLVMEYCGRDVCDLYDYIQKRNGGTGLKESEAKFIFHQICSAIAYCHSLRIVHRDLKPENLLIVNQSSNEDVDSALHKNNNNIDTEAGLPPTSNPLTSAEMLTSQTSHPVVASDSKTTASSPLSASSASTVTAGSGNSIRSSLPNYKYPIVKLIDFGFANQWQEGVKLGTSCGSLAYSAPEILLGGRYDGDKVDVWGLGCILYILLYGCNPFMQMNDNETLVRIIDCSFKTPDRSTISATVIRLIRSILIKEPSQRLTVAQVMADVWFEGMESDPVYQAPSTGTSVLSSASSHTPTPPSSPPVPQSLTSQQCGPNGDAIVASESKENISPVLIPSSSTSVPLRSKSPSTVNEVHERVIREMIAHKKELTKERVERALRLSRRPGSSLPAVVESAPLVLEPATAKVTNVRIDDDDSYITATYNLLKDKILKELQGIPISSGNTHEISSRSHHKKGHVLPGRRRGGGVSQAPRFGRPGSGRPLDDISLKKQLMEEQEKSQVVSEEEQDFRLPLQRKCSIVSEEGSCELSGRLSETGSDIQAHTILLGDGVEPIIQRRSVPVVDIVITDHDHEDCEAEAIADATDEAIHQKDEPAEDLSEEIDLRTCTGDRFEEVEYDEEDEDFDAQTSKDRDISPDAMDRELPSSATPAKIKNLLETSSRSERIHVVSSSPDLSKMVDEDEENRLEFVTDVIVRPDTAAHIISGKRPVTMFIDDPPCIKGQVIDDVADHVCRHQKRKDSKALDTSAASSTDPADGKQRGPPDPLIGNTSAASNEKSPAEAKASTKVTSVRIITQSKSCNNIVYNEKDRDGENNVHRKGSGRAGSGTSSAGDSKSRNKDRNDCCLIA